MGQARKRNSTGRRFGPFVYRRLKLANPNTGAVYQDRWGIELAPTDDMSLARIYLHRFSGPDPGRDMHDHPWPMASLVLKGAYREKLAEARTPSRYWYVTRRAGTVHRMGLGACHQITKATGPCWTIMLGGRISRPWGFYMPLCGWVDKDTYEATVRQERRDLAAVQGQTRRDEG